jgi:GAF domain
MEPSPEVRAGAERLAALSGIDVLDSIDAVAGVAVSIVPSCLGVSLTVVLDGRPFTVTSTSQKAAALDATQYLDGGPCVETAMTGATVSVPDVLSEDRWQTYGPAAAGLGVRSSLSLPMSDAEGQTSAAVNLYASEPDAFHDSAAILAAAFDVPAERLVANADLGFITRRFARELPDRIEAGARVDIAVGLLMAGHGWDATESRDRLRTAAARAGTTEDRVAELLLSLHQDALSR